MIRRQLLKLSAAAGLITLLGGHTPYGQWVVYRKKHLLIGCHRADPRTYELAQAVVQSLGEHLPDARARPARAPTAGRIASLLGTDQLEAAVLSQEDAVAMLHGSGAFTAYGAIPLRLLVPIGDRLLVVRSDFPERHAWLVAGALLDTKLVPVAAAEANFQVPWHSGSAAMLAGEPAPPPPGGTTSTR